MLAPQAGSLAGGSVVQLSGLVRWRDYCSLCMSAWRPALETGTARRRRRQGEKEERGTFNVALTQFIATLSTAVEYGLCVDVQSYL